MTRIMGDSTLYLNIPASVQVAATYANGLYAAAEADVAKRFPRTRYGWARIDVLGNMPDKADVRDWETGDKGGSLEQWVKDHNAHAGKKDAKVYCNMSTIPEVRQLTGSQILGKDYWLWIATLDGRIVAPGPVHLDSPPYTYPGTAACQVKGASLTGGDWDESLVYDASFWQPLPPPKPPVPPVTREQYTAALAVLLRAGAELPA